MLYSQTIESVSLTIAHHRANAYQFISDLARIASAKSGVKRISLLTTKPAD